MDKDDTQTTKRVCGVTAYKEDTKSDYVYELMEALEKAEAKYDKLQSRVPSWYTEEPPAPASS